MEGKQFSTSRGYSIFVRDFLERYDADALRFYLVAAGPETQDTDFTWAEFVRRNNDELLANWGNLVNRTLTNAHRNFGEVPQPGELTEGDRALLATIDAGFDEVGALIERGRFRAALGEAMRLSSEVNQYVSDQAPWALVKTDRDRAGTVLYVALRAVDSLKVIFTPFLPHSSQTLHELLGYDGWLAGPLEFRTVDEEGGRSARRAHRRLRRVERAAGSRASSRRARSCASRRRSSRSSTSRSSTTSSARDVIDTHAHLDPDEAPAILERARAAGVDRVITVATRIAGARDALALAERARRRLRLPRHPPPQRGRARRAPPRRAPRRCSRHPRAVAVGETGLDYFREYAPHDDAAPPLRGPARARAPSSASRS